MKKITIFLVLILYIIPLILTATTVSSKSKVLSPPTAIKATADIMEGIEEIPSNLEVVQEQTEIENQKIKLSNGKNAEIKVMPKTASEKALERLKLKVCNPENNCTIELKEVGKGNKIKAAYEIKVQKQVRFLALFKAKMQVQTQVDAENGEIIKTKKPWWAFLALEQE